MRSSFEALSTDTTLQLHQGCIALWWGRSFLISQPADRVGKHFVTHFQKRDERICSKNSPFWQQTALSGCFSSWTASAHLWKRRLLRPGHLKRPDTLEKYKKDYIDYRVYRSQQCKHMIARDGRTSSQVGIVALRPTRLILQPFKRPVRVFKIHLYHATPTWHRDKQTEYN